jgi:hypothetical protein
MKSGGLFSKVKSLFGDSTNTSSSTNTSMPSDSHHAEQVTQEEKDIEFANKIETLSKKVDEWSVVSIREISNYLNKIEKDEDKVDKADLILKELKGVRDSYSDTGDRMVVRNIMLNILKFASPLFQERMKDDSVPAISTSKAKILPDIFDNFKEAFRLHDDKDNIIDDNKNATSHSFKSK